MSRFIVDQSFWDLFPKAQIGVILLKDIEMSESSPVELVELLEESNEAALKYLDAPVFSENDVIAVWRDAFQKFKTKKGARSSIEALLKRANKGNPVSSINPLVDIYNAASLRYAMPIGALDIDKLEGNLRLTVTAGGDEFYLMGEEENKPTLEGELCYLDEAGAVCRNFNWRDGARTMITEETKDAIIICELIDETRVEDFQSLLDFIMKYSKDFLNADTHSQILVREQEEMAYD